MVPGVGTKSVRLEEIMLGIGTQSVGGNNARSRD